jgi:hypothetical protein
MPLALEALFSPEGKHFFLEIFFLQIFLGDDKEAAMAGERGRAI